jgi:phosphoadenosine phosphosulfate reductase
MQNAPRTRLDPAEVAGINQDLAGRHPSEIVRWALDRFDVRRAPIVTSLQADGMAVVDMALRIDPHARIVTIDTGRLPAETYAYLDTVRDHYGCTVEVRHPDRAALEAFTTEHGVNPFYRSVERRLDCCHIRKVEPLQRLLTGVDCWFTGLRRDHSAGRAAVDVVSIDREHDDILKVNPVAAWTEADTMAYIREHDVPLNPLYQRGYRSIGCAPCTRAVTGGEDPRAGRWWWEQGIAKECGIHGRPLAASTQGRL